MGFEKKENDKIHAPCRNCQGETRHLILASTSSSYTDMYAPTYKIYYKYSYQIIHCMGCETISFRLLSQDSESHPNTIVDDFGEAYESFYDEDIYPNPYGFRKSLLDPHILPYKIESIYKEYLLPPL